jgi:hypothetical protein
MQLYLLSVTLSLFPEMSLRSRSAYGRSLRHGRKIGKRLKINDFGCVETTGLCREIIEQRRMILLYS